MFKLYFTIILFRRLWKLHLHPSDWCAEERSGAAHKSGCFGSGLGSVPVFLVSHVWLTHWHSAHQAAAWERAWNSWRAALDSEWASGQPLERGSCADPTFKQSLSGMCLWECYLGRHHKIIEILYDAHLASQAVVLHWTYEMLARLLRRREWCIFLQTEMSLCLSGGDRGCSGGTELGRHCCGRH